MKRMLRLLVSSAALASAAGLQAASVGGEWEIDWWTIDGGGEIATEGGVWELSGTIGQWDASVSAPQSGGPWELTGGFWGVTTSETGMIFKDGFES